MHGLRTSFLLRGSDRLLTAGLVVASQAVFLWMFVSADPLEQALGSASALRFAADWRHGMAGNAWLYMPGFFATAAALWLHQPDGSRKARLAHLTLLCAIAALLAAIGSGVGARMVASDYAAVTAIDVTSRLHPPSTIGIVRGLYTLATWSAFVLACRSALTRRTWRPFLLPAVMTIGLALIRPWTVDDFTTLWIDRAAAADPIACGSAAAIVIVAALLGLSGQRSQSRSKPTWAAGTRRAETTSSR